MKKNIWLAIMIVALLLGTLSACGSGNTSAASDPVSLLVGSWNNEEAGVVTTFSGDGTFTTVQNGETILQSTYTAKKVDSTTITVTTGDGQSMTIVFEDDNTIKSEDTILIRLSEDTAPAQTDENTGTATSLETLIIGIWSSESGNIEFSADGNVYSNDSDGNAVSYTYTVTPIDSASVTVTITDTDGTASSETVVFQDNDTMTLGDTTFYRAG